MLCKIWAIKGNLDIIWFGGGGMGVEGVEDTMTRFKDCLSFLTCNMKPLRWILVQFVAGHSNLPPPSLKKKIAFQKFLQLFMTCNSKPLRWILVQFVAKQSKPFPHPPLTKLHFRNFFSSL